MLAKTLVLLNRNMSSLGKVIHRRIRNFKATSCLWLIKIENCTLLRFYWEPFLRDSSSLVLLTLLFLFLWGTRGTRILIVGFSFTTRLHVCSQHSFRLFQAARYSGPRNWEKANTKIKREETGEKFPFSRPANFSRAFFFRVFPHYLRACNRLAFTWTSNTLIMNGMHRM